MVHFGMGAYWMFLCESCGKAVAIPGEKAKAVREYNTLELKTPQEVREHRRRKMLLGDEGVMCECGHIRGWHYQGYGSCLECSCVEYQKKQPEMRARATIEDELIDHVEQEYGKAVDAQYLESTERCTGCGAPAPGSEPPFKCPNCRWDKQEKP